MLMLEGVTQMSTAWILKLFWNSRKNAWYQAYLSTIISVFLISSLKYHFIRHDFFTSRNDVRYSKDKLVLHWSLTMRILSHIYHVHCICISRSASIASKAVDYCGSWSILLHRIVNSWSASFKLNLILKTEDIMPHQRINVYSGSPSLSNQRRLQGKQLFGCQNPEGCLKSTR